MSQYIIDSEDLARIQERIRSHVDRPHRQDAARAWDAGDWARHHREGEALLEELERLLVKDELGAEDYEAELKAAEDEGWDGGFDEGKTEGRGEGYADGIADGKRLGRAEAVAEIARTDGVESVLDELVQRGKRSS